MIYLLFFREREPGSGKRGLEWIGSFRFAFLLLAGFGGLILQRKSFYPIARIIAQAFLTLCPFNVKRAWLCFISNSI
jgi:hypothetical protein